jgi:DNA-binding transcriptional LysR family regulator
MQIASLDLNLLLALDALLQEGSVTRAAQRLRLSQPALSAALAKLRRHFGDELLHRVGNHNELTPLALQLKERTGVALESVERIFASQPVFEPSTAQREFTLLGSDYAIGVIARVLGQLLYQRAPHLRLRLGQHRPVDIERARETLRTVDGILLPHGFLTDLSHTDLFEDRWVCLVATDNRLVGNEVSMRQLAELPWVMTYHSPTAYTPAVRQLQLLGVEPHVQVVVESFLALPFALVGTERVAIVQEQLAAHLATTGLVRALPCPFDVVPLREALWWHPMNARDPAHMWLRELLVEACETLNGMPEATVFPG